MSGFISNINISSYRGIKNLQLKDLEQINILTGDNNSGKTSVLEIINTFSQPDQIKSWLDVSREDNYLLGGISIYERLNDLFNVNSEEKKVEYIIETKTEQTKVELVGKDSEAELTEEDYYDKLGYLRVRDVEDENTGDVLITVPKAELEVRINGKKTDKLSVYEGQRRKTISLVKKGRREPLNTVYISPFGHINGNLFLNDILNNPELYEEMLEILKEFDPGIISINYDNGGRQSIRGFYKILSKENNRALPLNMYGDGMKKAVLLMSAVIKARDGILLLDEFETAIHTSAMDKVFKWILETSMKLNVQVFLTSHSREAIDKVLRCSEYVRSKTAIFTLYKDEEGNSVRRMTAEKALKLKEEMGLELR